MKPYISKRSARSGPSSSILVFRQKMLKPQPISHLLCWALVLAALLLHHGSAARCGTNIPTVRQTQVGFGSPPVFAVVVQNSCPVCPAIDVHISCGRFPQSLASPTVFRVVGFDDCVVNSGLPLAPLQKISFNYTHQRFPMFPKSWHYQCE